MKLKKFFEEKECPEGQRYCTIQGKCVPIGDGKKNQKKKQKGINESGTEKDEANAVKSLSNLMDSITLGKYI